MAARDTRSPARTVKDAIDEGLAAFIAVADEGAARFAAATSAVETSVRELKQRGRPARMVAAALLLVLGVVAAMVGRLFLLVGQRLAWTSVQLPAGVVFGRGAWRVATAFVLCVALCLLTYLMGCAVLVGAVVGAALVLAT